MYDDNIIGTIYGARYLAQTKAFDSYMMDTLRKELYKAPVYKVNTSDFDYFKQPWITYDNYIQPNTIIKLYEKENNKMEAKKCDRCGKLYEVPGACENGNGADVIFKYRRVSNAEDKSGAAIAKEQTRGIVVKTSSCGDYVDFCPECRASLKKWFENTDKEKK